MNRLRLNLGTAGRRQRHHLLAIAVATAAATLTLSACGDKAGGADSASSAKSSGDEGASKALASADQSGEKFTAYVDCYNDVDSDGRRMLESYSGWVKNLEAGPTGKEKEGYFSGTLSGHTRDDCLVTIPKAVAMKPTMPEMDAAATAYAKAIERLRPLAKDADQYYRGGGYKLDNFEHGKKIHPELLAAMRQFDSASKVMGEELEKFEDARQTTELAAMEKANGKNQLWWHMTTMRDAKKLVTYLQQDGFDVAQGQKLLDQYSESAKQSLAYGREHPKELPQDWEFFQSKYVQFLDSAKNRIERVRTKRPLDITEKYQPPSRIKGSAESVVATYNDLISGSNRLKWRVK